MKKISRNTTLLIASNALNNLLSFILLFVMARTLGDVVFGKYTFALSLAVIFATVADFGLNTYLIREISRKKKQAAEYIGNALNIKLVLSIITFILLVIVVNVLDYPQATKNIAYLGALYTFVEFIALAYRSTFKAYEQMEYEAILLVVYRIAVVLVGLLILLTNPNIVSLLMAFLILSIVYLAATFIIGSTKFSRPNLKPDIALTKKILKESAPFMITALLIALYFRIDVIILSFFKGDEVVGWYGAATTMIYSLLFIPIALSESILPQMSINFKKSKENLNRIFNNSTRIISIIIWPMMIGTTLLAKEFVVLLFSIEFVNATIGVQILVWALGIMFLNYILATTVNAINKQQVHTIIILIAAIINIVLNLILIPKYSIIGAGIAAIATQAIIFIALRIYLQKHTSSLIFKSSIKPIISSIIMGVAVFYLANVLHVVINLIAGIIIYLAIMYIIKGIHKEDITELKKIMTKN